MDNTRVTVALEAELSRLSAGMLYVMAKVKEQGAEIVRLETQLAALRGEIREGKAMDAVPEPAQAPIQVIINDDPCPRCGSAASIVGSNMDTPTCSACGRKRRI